MVDQGENSTLASVTPICERADGRFHAGGRKLISRRIRHETTPISLEVLFCGGPSRPALGAPATLEEQSHRCICLAGQDKLAPVPRTLFYHVVF